VIDKASGRVAYAVLKFSGAFLGIGRGPLSDFPGQCWTTMRSSGGYRCGRPNRSANLKERAPRKSNHGKVFGARRTGTADVEGPWLLGAKPHTIPRGAKLSSLNHKRQRSKGMAVY